jgi:CHAT domain-containing protein
MKILHLDLRPTGRDFAELRYFFENPNQYERRLLALKEIDTLIQAAEETYYVRLAEDYAVTGQRLYEWLDGTDRWLERTLKQHPNEGLVLAFSVVGKLAHLPWEILHDGSSFFVERPLGIVPVRWIPNSKKQLLTESSPDNRALNVLFMATSPQKIEPVLDFEAEEGQILEATVKQPLGLTVEESGCLIELADLVSSYDRGYFDVFHLTGHATMKDGQPCFITESETGEPVWSNAKAIAKALRLRAPKLVFLSGCRTGQAGESGAVPSLAEELLKEGAQAVLSWGQKVLDSDATTAAAALYQALSEGYELTEAIALTYQALIHQKARDWHLLRLYITGALPGQLVTPLRTPGRKPAPPPSVATQFLDTEGKIKVPTRQSFVGRRHQLQNCLRSLKSNTDKLGVLIYGMGGFGKSSLAARLCDRLADFDRIIWVGLIDEPTLVKRLSEKLESQELYKVLQNQDVNLKFRLKQVFQRLIEEGKKPLLLVLDDFETNLEVRTSGFVLRPDGAEVLNALVQAMQEIDTVTSHRIVITCRYDFEFTQLQYFYKQPLNTLRGQGYFILIS